MNAAEMDDLPVSWQPSSGAFASSPAGRMAARYGITDPGELARRAHDDPEWYWAAGAEDVGIEWMRRYEKVLDLDHGPEYPTFFAGGLLNWADYSVDRWVRNGRAESRALWWEGDDASSLTLSYAELKAAIDSAAGALRDKGVRRGDVVAILLPMIPEAAIAVLAVVKIGAIAAPLFSGYGAGAVRQRLEHSAAKALITADGFPRRGRMVRLKDVADEATDDLPDLRTVLVVRRSGTDVTMVEGRDWWWDEAGAQAQPVTAAEPMASDDPCMLMFTSGSTGKPKGCVHTHAGLPFKLALEARHAFGVDETSAVLWLTDMGWIMGTYILAAALTNGGTAVLFEGVPDWPEPDRLWAVAKRSGTTELGLSPTLIRSLMANGPEWVDRHELTDLRAIGSTGEPWDVESWEWCFQHVGREQVPIVNISGGTEIGGSLVSGATYLPAKAASFAGPTLGARTDVVDEAGRSVRGQVGELVVRSVWPGMTKGFWAGDDRYLSTYWERYPGIWHHGDLAYIDRDGFWFLLGRSDDTIKVAGKRLGPVEVESLLVADERVVEAAAVGVPDPIKGEALVCFVVLHEGRDPEEASASLQASVTTALGKAMAPKHIWVVDALPKTRNGKLLRRVARNAYVGAPLGDLSALEDAGTLEAWPHAESATVSAGTSSDRGRPRGSR